MASLWTTNYKSNPSRAPSSMFSNTKNLSPRQIATKACNLTIKKLDRDDKRSRPQYNVRERLLLCNTLSNAEKFLQKRTPRTNRRVMAFEEEGSDSPMEERRCPPPPMDDQAQNMTMEMALQQQSIGHDAFVIPHDTDDDDDDESYLDHPMTPTYSHQQAQCMTLEMALQQSQPSSNGAFVIPQDDQDFLQYPSSFLIPNTNNTNAFSSDYCSLGQQSPIASII